MLQNVLYVYHQKSRKHSNIKSWLIVRIQVKLYFRWQQSKQPHFNWRRKLLWHAVQIGKSWSEKIFILKTIKNQNSLIDSLLSGKYIPFNWTWYKTFDDRQILKLLCCCWNHPIFVTKPRLEHCRDGMTGMTGPISSNSWLLTL